MPPFPLLRTSILVSRSHESCSGRWTATSLEWRHDEIVYDFLIRLYLTSFRLGLYPAELVRVAGGCGTRTLVVNNATDHLTTGRGQHNERVTVDLRGIGLVPEELDLRDYFDDSSALLRQVEAADLI